jgi:hypothetical protein
MDHNVTHATFTLERSYPVPPAQVFAAWADPAARPAGSRQAPVSGTSSTSGSAAARWPAAARMAARP